MHWSIYNFPRSVHRAPHFGVFPAPFNHFLYMRCASTASSSSSNEDPSSHANLYPFPKHAHPTPHEIFHLRPGARPSEIKSRYYQLVRIHHPDTPHARRLPSHISRARFQAIQAAHDVLIGKSRRSDFAPYTHSNSTAPRGHTVHKHRRAHQHHAEWAQAAEEVEESEVDRQTDKMIVFGAIAAVGLAAIPFLTSSANSGTRHNSAVQNLAQARREGREFGMMRRQEIRKRVRVQELEREYEEKLVSNGSAASKDSRTDLG